MNRLAKARRHRGDDRGMVLILALVVLVLVGLLLASSLTYVGTSLRAGHSVRSDSVALYAAGGAADAAITSLRGDLELGRDGGDCPDVSLPASDGRSAVVRCDPADGSGADLGGPAPDVPPWALVTTATVASGEDGVVLSGPNAELGIGGPVFSRSTVRVGHQGSRLTTRLGPGPGHPVRVVGGCDAGRIVADPDPACDLGPGAVTESDVAGLFPAPLDSLPDRVDVPSCPGAGGYVALAPGWYDDAAALDALSGCGAVLHFLPGVHYFDFRGADTRWDVDDRNTSIVAGTAQGWAPGSAPPSEGACAPDGPGATFVFGGESRLRVRADAAFEICGAQNATGQRVAMHGLDTAPPPEDPGDPSAPVTVHPTAQTAPITGSGTPFAPGLAAVDGLVNTGNVNGRGASGGVTLTGYSLPPGTPTDAVTLRVGHRHVTNPQQNVASVRVDVTAPGAACSVALAVQSSLTVEEHPVPCLAGRASFDGVELSYRVQLRSNGNPSAQVDLDGLDLVVGDDGAEPDGLRAQSGCVVEVGGCPLIEVISLSAGNRPVLLARGTVYVPAGLVDLDFKNNTVVRFERGLVARALRVGGIPPAELVGAISVPHDGGRRADREVALVVEVGGHVELRAVVRVDDGEGLDPGREVEVLVWDSIDRR